jgi:hypothetical protein
MACHDEIIPLQERIETVGDDADLQDVYDTERHLLYVSGSLGGFLRQNPVAWWSVFRSTQSHQAIAQ